MVRRTLSTLLPLLVVALVYLPSATLGDDRSSGSGTAKYSLPPLSVKVYWTSSGTFGADFELGGQSVSVSGIRTEPPTATNLACAESRSNNIFAIGSLVCVLEECAAPADSAFLQCHDGPNLVFGPLPLQS